MPCMVPPLLELLGKTSGLVVTAKLKSITYSKHSMIVLSQCHRYGDLQP